MCKKQAETSFYKHITYLQNDSSKLGIMTFNLYFIPEKIQPTI